MPGPACFTASHSCGGEFGGAGLLTTTSDVGNVTEGPGGLRITTCYPLVVCSISGQFATYSFILFLLAFLESCCWGKVYVVGGLEGGLTLGRSCDPVSYQLLAWCCQPPIALGRAETFERKLPCSAAPTPDSHQSSTCSARLGICLSNRWGVATLAEEICRLVLLGVRTCSPFEQGILHLWIGGLGARGGPPNPLTP